MKRRYAPEGPIVDFRDNKSRVSGFWYAHNCRWSEPCSPDGWKLRLERHAISHARRALAFRRVVR